VSTIAFPCSGHPIPMSGRRQKQFRASLAEHGIGVETPSASSQTSPPNESSGTSSSLDSELCKILAEEWAWGALSAAKLQRIAHAAYLDAKRVSERMFQEKGIHVPESVSLREFASLGGFGVQSGNVARDLKLVLGEPNVAPVHIEKLPTKILKPGFRLSTVSDEEHGFFLPHRPFVQTQSLTISRYVFGSRGQQTSGTLLADSHTEARSEIEEASDCTKANVEFSLYPFVPSPRCGACNRCGQAPNAIA